MDKVPRCGTASCPLETLTEEATIMEKVRLKNRCKCMKPEYQDLFKRGPLTTVLGGWKNLDRVDADIPLPPLTSLEKFALVNVQRCMVYIRRRYRDLHKGKDDPKNPDNVPPFDFLRRLSTR